MSINVSSAKVMNSLYNNNNGTTTFYTGISSRSTIKVNTDVENSISANSEFQRAVRGLKRCNFETGLKSEIKKYTKKLVDSFNKVISSDGNSSKRFTARKNELIDLVDKYSDELSKAGITKTEGRLKFDTSKFDDAKLSDIENILSGKSDFISSSTKIISSMNNMIKGEVCQTVKEDIFVSNNVNSNNIQLAGITNRLAVDINEMLNTPLADDESNENAILSMLNGYIDHINSFYDEITDNTDIEYSAKASDSLNSIFELNNEFVEETKKDPFPYNDLFNKEDPSSYGNQIQQMYRDLFSELVNASAKDFSISSFVDYQV